MDPAVVPVQGAAANWDGMMWVASGDVFLQLHPLLMMVTVVDLDGKEIISSKQKVLINY